MLEPILQQVGAGNPQLAQLIGHNREQFLQLLSEDVDDDAPLPPGAQAISVTEEEREAIERVSPCLPSMTKCFLQQKFFLRSYSPEKISSSSLLTCCGNSCVDSASKEISSSKPISPATRMRNWRRISYSINPTIRRILDMDLQITVMLFVVVTMRMTTWIRSVFL